MTLLPVECTQFPEGAVNPPIPERLDSQSGHPTTVAHDWPNARSPGPGKAVCECWEPSLHLGWGLQSGPSHLIPFHGLGDKQGTLNITQGILAHSNSNVGMAGYTQA